MTIDRSRVAHSGGTRLICNTCETRSRERQVDEGSVVEFYRNIGWISTRPDVHFCPDHWRIVPNPLDP